MLTLTVSPVLVADDAMSGQPLALPALDGRGTIALADYRGQVVLLDFWASWCVPCRKSLPLYAALQEQLGDEGLQVLAVSLDENPDDARRFLERYPVNYPVMIDQAATSPARWQVRGMPTAYLIDRQGQVIRGFVGFEPGHEAELERAIATALGKLDG